MHRSDFKSDFSSSHIEIPEAERRIETHKEWNELFFMDFEATMFSRKDLPGRVEFKLEFFTELIDWIVGIKMIFFELLDDNKDEKIQENELNEQNVDEPECKSTLYEKKLMMENQKKRVTCSTRRDAIDTAGRINCVKHDIPPIFTSRSSE